MAFDLQSESDVKEYIEKLGIEYRFGCYSEKKPEGELIGNDVNLLKIIFFGFSLSSTRRLSRKYQERFRESIKGVQIQL